jgi:membrane dipeptidase
VCSTHSNARAVAEVQRNLSDWQIGELARRGGVIGLNLLAPMVQAGWRQDMPLPSIGETTRHPEHIAGLVGPEYTGLGSDLDGGLMPDNTPAGIDSVTDLTLILDQLAQDGWTAEQVAGFAGRNWWRFFADALPA